MKSNVIGFLFNNFWSIIFLICVLTLIFYFFGKDLTLEDNRNEIKQSKNSKKYTYFFRLDILGNQIGFLIAIFIIIVIALLYFATKILGL